MKKIQLCEKKDCLSCGSCYCICPNGAITMQKDELGKLIPIIDRHLCVGCGLCERACPQLQIIEKRFPIKCFAGYTKDQNDRLKCASGGFATAIGKSTIRCGGVVYGVLFHDRVLKFEPAKDEQQLRSFRGSKYVFAFPDKVYADVKTNLISGVQCTFIGLPCQVAGLLSYLGKKYDNLLTVDLICHGAPPFEYLQEHLKDIGCEKEYYDIKFRGERNYFFTVLDDKDKILYSKKQQENVFFEAFMSGLICRECCYTCPFACSERVSDITLGDFWGISKTALAGYRGRISCALVNTEKGSETFQRLSNDLVLEPRRVQEAITGNSQLREPTRKHFKRNIFESVYIRDGFLTAMKETGILFEIKKNIIKNCLLYFPKYCKKIIKNRLK